MATTRTRVVRKQAGEIVKETAVDANSTSSVAPAAGYIDARGASLVTMQVVSVSGAHSNHVIKLQGSVDGVTFVDTATTLTGPGSATLTSLAHPFYRAKVTTGEGGASVVEVYLFAKAA